MIKDTLFDGEEVIFVYTIGKTATASLSAPIRKWSHSKGILYMDSHTLFNESVIKHQRKLWRKGVRVFAQSVKNSKPKKVNIISAVREPIGREISSFLQNLDRFWNNPYEGNPIPPEELWKACIRSKRGNWCLEWFDNEMLANFDIDVYSKPWPEKGYEYFESEKANLLLMRHDLDNEVKSSIIEDFLGAESGSIPIVNLNTAGTKWYREIAKDIKSIKLPKEYCDFMLNSKYTTHFFSDEIEKLREKYQEK